MSARSDLPRGDALREDVDVILSAWAEAAGAVSRDGQVWLGPTQVWPSDYVLSFLVRALPVSEILAALASTTLNRFEASPRDLGGFYHRCYDRVREREDQTARDVPAEWAEVLRTRDSAGSITSRWRTAGATGWPAHPVPTLGPRIGRLFEEAAPDLPPLSESQRRALNELFEVDATTGELVR